MEVVFLVVHLRKPAKIIAVLIMTHVLELAVLNHALNVRMEVVYIVVQIGKPAKIIAVLIMTHVLE